MAEKKSIIEDALLDINKIQEALNANTKEILRSVAKEEIDGVVKESLMNTEGVYEEEDLEGPMGSDDMKSSEEVAPEMEPELGMDDDSLEDGAFDMTKATDDDVMKIYKKLSGEDEIEIIGDEIHLNITEPGEYIVKMKDEAGEEEYQDSEEEYDDSEEEMDLDLDGEDDSEELDLDDSEDEDDSEENEYELEIDDEEDETEEEAGESDEYEAGEEEEEEEEETEEEPLEEFIQKNNVKRAGNNLTDIKSTAVRKENTSTSKQLVLETTKKYNALLTEAKKLKSENEEFRAALKEFRTKLVETVVFNSNLTYVTRILMEHSTTKAEKQTIIKRFDEEVTNLKESKNLYKTIVNQLDSRSPINETVQNKIIKEVTTGSSKQLNESTAYVDPSTKRIIDLMKRVG
jgi:hypothetical protein